MKEWKFTAMRSRSRKQYEREVSLLFAIWAVTTVVLVIVTVVV
jgi:hypothetical protein